ncbi:hypothetical protein [Roseibium sp. RKSG952]|uniref:hypothetical protein n=1 Tax=Roseibium sp. RKSG952 TaxID=2529384 RepID=UPI0012BCFC6C|nr:hypothetical protein [Roseibium sp. RKSG952]MTH95195.1 hypothetical protein [Roseibium sp. RKSG952]
MPKTTLFSGSKGGLFGLSALLLATVKASPLLADIVFNYDPGSPASIGRSVDYRNPTQTKLDCLENQNWGWVETETTDPNAVGGVVSVQVNGEYTDDYREIYRKLNFNASFKASAAISEVMSAGSDGSLKINYDYTGKFSDLSYVLVASYDFGSRRLNRPTLRPEYQSLINNGNHDEFIARCGTHYVAREEMWAYAAIVVDIDRLDETVKRHLLANYGSETKIVELASAELKLGVDGAYNNARKYGVATLRFHANGGDPTKASELAEVAQSNNLAKALSGMKVYMSGISRSTSVPKRAYLASFSNFGLDIEEDTTRDRFLEAAYFTSLKYQSALEAANARLATLEAAQRSGLDLNSIYERDIIKLNNQKAALDELTVVCVRDGACDLSAIRDAAPLISYRTTLLREPILEASCQYEGADLARVAVRVLGTLVDPNAAQELAVYRILEYTTGRAPEELSIRRTRFNADPHNRFQVGFELNDDPYSELILVDEVRRSRFEMSVRLVDGSLEWYNLGYPSIREDNCPLKL